MTKKENKQTDSPLIQQYFRIKAQHPDAVLLFRVGDFYETYGDDAVGASKILGITLTRKSNGCGTFIEMAGFPYHAVETYLPKLVREGCRVAVCEQLEDPKTVKGLVKRGVIELVTPGVVMNENVLSSKENTFLASICFGSDATGIALLDLSTGEFYAAEGKDDYIDRLVSDFAPKEILYQRGYEDRFAQCVGGEHYTYRLDGWVYNDEINREKLCKQFGTRSLKGFGIERMKAAISAAGAALYYLDFTEHKEIAHIDSISRIDPERYVWIDRFTIRNLELFSSNSSSSRQSFIDVVDSTVTPMGGRLLKHWITMPVKDTVELKKRLDTVEHIKAEQSIKDGLDEALQQIGDMERMASRIATRRILPREVVALGRSLAAVEQLQVLLTCSEAPTLVDLGEQLDPCKSARQLIEHTIYPDPQTNQIQKGGVIADGIDLELDDLRNLATHGKERIAEIQRREAASTGISTLRVSYNNVFGYYIEVRNSQRDKVPSDWVRKQTLANAERYITAELKEYEEKILGAQERILQIEQRLWDELLLSLAGSIQSIQKSASTISRIDCLSSFAKVAAARNYVRPEVADDKIIDIRDGRHPVIETLMPVGEQYIPNDVYLDDTTQQIMMITGPNMSGKSALLRQTALIVLMSQIGSFVPAASAHIGVVDKIFTRVGASDNISQGESTFMVEMLESASILNNLSDRSLILLDEIGRGTSTYDGISIAWAMVEYIHNHPHARAKTMFATHYHELNEMEESLERVKNYNVSVREVNRTVLFLRKLERGGTAHSFGIHVAKLAGMPSKVVERAEQILTILEEQHAGEEIEAESAPTATQPSKAKGGHKTIAPADSLQLSMFQLDDPVLIQIRDQIRDIDINALTPLEALNKLNEIKKITGL